MRKKSFWCSISWTLLTYSHYFTHIVFPTFGGGFIITLKSTLAGKSAVDWIFCLKNVLHFVEKAETPQIWEQHLAPHGSMRSGQAGWSPEQLGQEAWNERIFKVPSNPRLSMILWSHDLPFAPGYGPFQQWAAHRSLGCSTDVFQEEMDTWKLIPTSSFPIIVQMSCKNCD